MTEHWYKLVVLGTGGVGKSALTLKYVQDHFIVEYEPTIEDSYVKSVSIEGRQCILDILDTSGQEEYAAMRDQHWNSGDGFICVYAIDDCQSFEQLDDFIEKLLQLKGAKNIPMILVGNKIDLEKRRAVDNFLANEYARKKSMPFIETSAKTGHHVNEMFSTIIGEIERYKTLPKDHVRPGGGVCCEIL